MSAEPLKVPQPVCEMCWIKEYAEWEPESIDGDGNILMRLRGIDIPHKYNLETVETCWSCGKMTIAGIYKMVRPEANSLKEAEEFDFFENSFNPGDIEEESP
jgi:hypothetical protein